MKSIFEKDFFTWKNLRETWEAKLTVFIVRAFFALGVFLLILTFPYKAWLWAELQWVKKDSISRLEPLILESTRLETPEDITKWLVYRSPGDSAALLDIVPTHAANLESLAFFNLSSRAEALGKKDDAVFWYFYALYRLRYDLLRCGSPDSIQVMSGIRTVAGAKTMYEDIEADSEKMAVVLQRVLDYDAKFPATNHPGHLCKAVNRLQRGSYRVVEKSQWSAIRHMLRLSTERGIKEMKTATDRSKK